MGLIRKDIMVKPSSTTEEEVAIATTLTWLNNLQNNQTNKNPDNSFKDYFYGDLFDCRSKRLIRVFSTEAQTKYTVPETIVIVDMPKLETVTDNHEERLDNLETISSDDMVLVIE